jgi:hypothetical protein
MRVRDPESLRPWIRDGKIQIRDRRSGSATLINTKDKKNFIKHMNVNVPLVLYRK